ncbi:hypothetical protein [Pseudaminobacter sp. NGMCC 1.201702]|uniref:hypothetical protein n=1 Tax=Pseudaminobacter sp. NGMCC 1.201702 TaxID=3391825 RepID=UPI0039EFF9E2
MTRFAVRKAHDTAMTRKKLNDKLDCKACGTIQMDIPEHAEEHTPIHRANCGVYLGQWGELQDDLAKQIRDAEVLDLDQGTITKTS